MKGKITENIEIPENIEVKVNKGVINIKGKQGELSRDFYYPNINIKIENKKIIFECEKGSKREKKLIKTSLAHIKNMIKGVSEKHVYKIKTCSGHFPMNVSISKNQLIIKNFVGEKKPRILELKQGVDVKIDGNIITIEGVDKELAGQTAASIEQLTRRPGFDIRIFQDGCFIIQKDGKDVI